jgi:hypothetical protein
MNIGLDRAAALLLRYRNHTGDRAHHMYKLENLTAIHLLAKTIITHESILCLCSILVMSDRSGFINRQKRLSQEQKGHTSCVCKGQTCAGTYARGRRATPLAYTTSTHCSD